MVIPLIGFQYASEGRLAERCRLLSRVDFLVLTYQRAYELTTMGLRYLDWDLDPTLPGSRSTNPDGPAPSRR